MSNFTEYGENLTADFFRGRGLSALPVTFYIGLAVTALDGAITELSGSGYARQPYGRGLTQWSGTQGPSTTLASTGATHTTSNNNAISFGTAGGAWGTANFAVIYDALTGGNALSYHPLTVPLSIGGGSPVSLAIGAISMSLGLAGGMSDYLANAFIDFWWRAVTFTFPSSGFFALFIVAPNNAGGGVEVSGGGYARQSLPFTTSGLSATNGPGTTVFSTGTSGIISNNLPIAFPSPTANQGTIGWEGVFDALTGGNLLFWNALDLPRTVLAGSLPQTHAPGTWTITIA